MIQPQYVIKRLYELTKGEAIITTGVGQHQMWAGQYYNFDKPRTFITGGAWARWALAIRPRSGAKVAHPDKQVIDIDGDGSFLMNIQELATAHIEKIAAKVIILNNQHLGMVVQWEDRFHGGNRGHTYLGDPRDLKRIYPDYVEMCKGFGVTCERVRHKKDVGGGDPADARFQGDLRARCHDAVHRARASDDPFGDDLQGHHHRVSAFSGRAGREFPPALVKVVSSDDRGDVAFRGRENP